MIKRKLPEDTVFLTEWLKHNGWITVRRGVVMFWTHPQRSVEYVSLSDAIAIQDKHVARNKSKNESRKRIAQAS